MVKISDDIIQDDKFVMTALSVDLPEYPPIPGITRAKVHLHTLTPSLHHTHTPSHPHSYLQILPGSGWVLEPYDGSRMSTLVSYVAHVSQ